MPKNAAEAMATMRAIVPNSPRTREMPPAKADQIAATTKNPAIDTAICASESPRNRRYRGRPPDWPRGLPRCHVVRDGDLPAPVPPVPRTFRRADRGIDCRILGRRGDLVRLRGRHLAGPRRIRDDRPHGGHGLRGVLRHVWRRTVSRSGPVPGSDLCRLEPATGAHDRLPEPSARTRSARHRSLHGSVRVHARPCRPGTRGGPPDDVDGSAQPRPVPRGGDVRTMRLPPCPIAAHRRAVGCPDAGPIAARRERPRLPIPSPPRADEPSQAVRDSETVAGGETRWQATEFPGSISRRGGSDDACKDSST